MEISTGNFGNVKKYKAAGYHCVSIALTARYFTGSQYRPLNPEWWYMKKSQDEYVKAFNQGLSKLSAEKVVVMHTIR